MVFIFAADCSSRSPAQPTFQMVVHHILVRFSLLLTVLGDQAALRSRGDGAEPVRKMTFSEPPPPAADLQAGVADFPLEKTTVCTSSGPEA
jgi:hypothetical protein